MKFQVVGLVCATLSCSPQAVAETGAGGPRGDRFYGRETFTIEYEQSGAEAGTVTEHVRDWGRRRVEIVKTTIRVSTVTINKDTRAVFDGANVATVDNATGGVTTTTNPLYDDVVTAMRGRSGVEFGEELMTRMGGKKTGEKGSFAGHECEYWEVASLKTKSCVTPWGATLHISSSLVQVGFERKATAVRIGDGGPDAAFAYDASKAKATPNIEELMRQIPGQNLRTCTPNSAGYTGGRVPVRGDQGGDGGAGAVQMRESSGEE